MASLTYSLFMAARRAALDNRSCETLPTEMSLTEESLTAKGSDSARSMRVNAFETRVRADAENAKRLLRN
jgi:hypothetical protein